MFSILQSFLCNSASYFISKLSPSVIIWLEICHVHIVQAVSAVNGLVMTVCRCDSACTRLKCLPFQSIPFSLTPTFLFHSEPSEAHTHTHRHQSATLSTMTATSDIYMHWGEDIPQGTQQGG